MRVCGGGGGGCARGHHSGRGLFVVGAPQPLASDPSLDAQRAQLERAMAAITTVVSVASVSYVVLSTIFGCLCTGSASRQQQPGGGGGGTWGQRPAAAVLETKRALEEIPVVVVQVPVPRDPGSGSGGAGAAEDGGPEEPGECAVCLAEYAGGEEVRVLPACRHGFHRECVDRWLLTRAPTCPVCRAIVAARAEAPDAKDRATGDIDAALP